MLLARQTMRVKREAPHIRNAIPMGGWLPRLPYSAATRAGRGSRSIPSSAVSFRLAFS